jgi:hypothetical protein
MDVSGAGHQLLIRQGVGEVALARGSVAKQKIRSTGHTVVIEQDGARNTATQRLLHRPAKLSPVDLGTMPSLNFAN